MTRIWIENNELDINKGLSNQITYAIDDLINIDSKATAFSKTIVLPGTANNNNLLGNIFEFNQANFTDDTAPNVGYNFNAAKSAQCRIEVNGLTIIKGTFRLLEIIVDGGNVEYEVAVFGELGGFVSKLGALKLSDLDFSAYDHNLTVTNIVNSWDAMADGSGYCYPLIDYGADSSGVSYSTTKRHWRLGTFRPALFVKEYLDKIITNAGYTYDLIWSTTAEETRWNSLIIPHNRKILTRTTTNILEANALSAAQNLNAFTGQLFDYTGYIITLGSFTTTDDQTFTFNSSSSIVCKVNLTMGLADFNGVDDIIFKFQVNGTTVRQIAVNADGQYDLSVNSLTLNNGDTVRVRCESIILTNSVDISSRIQIESLTAIPTPILDGNPVKLNETIPANILQKDFVTSILKLFNLYVYEDRYKEKHLNITPYIYFYPNVIEDWSDKVDRSKPIKLKPMSELNSRYYQFKYKSDSDYYNDLYRKRYNEGYGDRIFDSTYEFATETKSLELIFAGTPLVGYGGESKRYSTIFKKTNSGEESTDSVIRILQGAKITGVASWQLQQDNGTPYASYTKYGFAGHVNHPTVPTNDINFGAPKEIFFTFTSGNLSANQFNVYYSTYMAEITDKDSRLLTCFVKLTDVDVFNLDFSKYYYIDGGLYRLIKLIDYTPQDNGVTQAQFLRVIYTDYSSSGESIPPID